MVLTARQSRHMRCSRVTREEGTDALITMPGMRTSREMFSACRSRMAIKLAVERSVTWQSGASGLSSPVVMG